MIYVNIARLKAALLTACEKYENEVWPIERPLFHPAFHGDRGKFRALKAKELLGSKTDPKDILTIAMALLGYPWHGDSSYKGCSLRRYICAELHDSVKAPTEAVFKKRAYDAQVSESFRDSPVDPSSASHIGNAYTSVASMLLRRQLQEELFIAIGPDDKAAKMAALEAFNSSSRTEALTKLLNDATIPSIKAPKARDLLLKAFPAYELTAIMPVAGAEGAPGSASRTATVARAAHAKSAQSPPVAAREAAPAS